MRKHLLLILLITLTFSQFSIPDLAQVGETIKNEAVKVEQSVQNFAKEQIHIAQVRHFAIKEKINEELEKIKGETHGNSPKVEEKQALKPESPILIGGAPIAEAKPEFEVKEASVAPLNPAIPVAIQIKAETTQKPKDHVQLQKVKEQKIKQKKGKEHRKEQRKDQKDEQRKEHRKEQRKEQKNEQRKEHRKEQKNEQKKEHRKEQKNEQKKEHRKEQRKEQRISRQELNSDDIEIKRAEKHKQGKDKRKQRHQYTPEELKKKSQQRQKKIKQKEEKMKKYDNQHKHKSEKMRDDKLKNREIQTKQEKGDIQNDNGYVKLLIEEPKNLNLQINYP